MSEDRNPREELYRRFRESLAKPVLERYFDEDELVEIYDYAGDLNDDYVQMEVLFCGARLFPESRELAERKCLLYLDTSIDDSDEPSPAAGAFLNDNADESSPLLDIARLEVNPPENPQEALEFLLTQYAQLNDEEMIRFLDLAFDLGCYQWVVDNLGRIRTRIDNQPLIMYELVREADSMQDNKTMETAAEELIEAEPFAVLYWGLLFRAQARGGREEEARSTFDYATSLAGDDPEAILAIASDAYSFAPYLHKEAYDLLEEAKKANPDRFAFSDMQAALLVSAGSPGPAISVIRDFLNSYPGDHSAMRQLLRCNVCDVEDYLDRFMVATEQEGFTAEEMDELMGALTMGTAYRSLAAMMKISGPVSAISPMSFCAFAEAHFALGHYQTVVDMVAGYSDKEGIFQIPLKGAALSFVYMVSLMKTGHSETDALAHFEKVRPTYESVMAESPMPIKMCVRLVFTLADKIRRHPASEKFYWEAFDMLWYSKF